MTTLDETGTTETFDYGRFTEEEVKEFWARMVAESDSLAERDGDLYVIFRMGQAWFAIRADTCRGVVEFTTPSPLPVLPGHILGVASIRGRPISVTDLGAFFGMKTSDRGGHLLIVQDGGEETAIKVGWVDAVARLDDDTLTPVPAKWRGLRSGLVLGLVSIDGREAILINTARCLRPDEQT